MGSTVLDAGVSNGAGLHVYTHCLRGVPGGVAVLLLNTGRTGTQSVTVPVPSGRYTLTARKLDGHAVELNGTALTLGHDDALPSLNDVATSAGRLDLAPATITFLTLPSTGNDACH
jgi:hypothetical protein